MHTVRIMLFYSVLIFDCVYIYCKYIIYPAYEPKTNSSKNELMFGILLNHGIIVLNIYNYVVFSGVYIWFTLFFAVSGSMYKNVLFSRRLIIDSFCSNWLIYHNMILRHIYCDMIFACFLVLLWPLCVDTTNYSYYLPEEIVLENVTMQCSATNDRQMYSTMVHTCSNFRITSPACE